MEKARNEYGFEIFEGGHGRKENQKLKPYLVLQYLLRQSDENHVHISHKHCRLFAGNLRDLRRAARHLQGYRRD